MSFSPQQIAAIKAAIAADPVLAGASASDDGSDLIAKAFNVVGATDVWRTDAPVDSIYDSIDWTKYTPTTVPALSDLPAASAWFLNQCATINIKQMNLQNMLFGRVTLNCSRAGIRAGLRDAVIALPAGTAGAPVSAGGSGGVNVLAVCVRKATRLEALLAAAVATTGPTSANVLVFEGAVSYAEISAVRSAP